MGNVKIGLRGEGVGAGAPAMPAAAEPGEVPQRSGALGIGELGALAPLADPTYSDGYDAQAPSEGAARDNLSAPPRDANAFGALARSADALMPERSLGESSDAEAAGDLSAAALAKLLSFEGKLLGSEALAKIRLGTMLLAYDVQEPVYAYSGFHSVAEKLYLGNTAAAKEAFTSFVKQHAQALLHNDEDVNALVQRVLREAYLMGSEQLRDYAERVKHFNAMKKKTRELLKNAREVQAQWSSLAAGDEGFVADTPYECQDIDTVTGEVFVPSFDAAGATAFAASQQAAATSRGVASDGVLRDWAVFVGPSRLDTKDRVFLREVRDGDDDFVKDNLEYIKELLGKMNQEEISTYFSEIAGKLIEPGVFGDTDEEELIQLFEALSPLQAVEAMASSGTGKYYYAKIAGLNDSEQARIRLVWNTGAAQLSEELGRSFDYDLTMTDARELLDAAAAKLASKHASVSDAKPEATGEPGPKRVNTVDGMTSYVKSLEEKLNGIGDDAQLANVDLQNELQKQQQLLQMMSNISKVLHDTAMSVIRKIGT